MGQQVVYLFTTVFSIGAYAWVQKNYAIFAPNMSSPLAWIALMILVDHSFYWFHRASHRVNFLWAGHAVHHQSEEYNLTVALRQSAIPVSWVFYLPLAFIGFPPPMFLVVSAIDTLYQFWIHTRLVGRLGPLEWVLNTPSHHRVHHGRNPRYITDLDLSAVDAAPLAEAPIAGADLVCLAVPSRAFREVAEGLPGSAPVLSLTKGLDPQTGARLSTVVGDRPC